MRIISGQLRGRRIELPKDINIRPSSDRLRSGLFSSLESAGVLEGSSVLDLYAGSGSLGLEAISRGAQLCVFVETQQKICRLLEDCIERLGIEDRALVFQAKLPEEIKQLAKASKDSLPFDLIFADPPYDMNLAELPGLLASHGLVGPGAMFIAETRGDAAQIDPSKDCASFVLEKERKYGDSLVRFYRFE